MKLWRLRRQLTMHHLSIMERALVDAHRLLLRAGPRVFKADGPEQYVESRRSHRAKRPRPASACRDQTCSPDENAQEIFETLNARGAQLTAADLIKNFIFQKLQETDADVEKAYENTGKNSRLLFGRQRSVRAASLPTIFTFINHWLISRTGEEVVARQVFARFKTFADHEANVPMDSCSSSCRGRPMYIGDYGSTRQHSGASTEWGFFPIELVQWRATS